MNGTNLHVNEQWLELIYFTMNQWQVGGQFANTTPMNPFYKPNCSFITGHMFWWFGLSISLVALKQQWTSCKADSIKKPLNQTQTKPKSFTQHKLIFTKTVSTVSKWLSAAWFQCVTFLLVDLTATATICTLSALIFITTPLWSYDFICCLEPAAG